MRVGLVGAGFALSALFGCGSGEIRSSAATGKVTFGGQPVTVGTIHFVSPANGYAGSSPLDGTGSYKIADGMPPGSYMVYVVPPSITKPPMPGEPPPAPQDYPNIPPKARSESTSGLTAEVKQGTNAFDFKLD